jgi:hypothetical protein
MGVIIGILVIFALIAAIFGRDKAQGLFHAVFGTISILVLIGITIAAPPIGLGAIAFIAFICFCKWAAQDSQNRAERMEQQRQTARMSQGIGQMQGMLAYMNAATAKVAALPSAPSGPSVTYSVPATSSVTPLTQPAAPPVLISPPMGRTRFASTVARGMSSGSSSA